MEEFPDLLTLREAARLLSVSEPIVRRMIESRLLPLYRISGVVRFDRQDVIGYIENNRTPNGEVNTYIARHKSHPRRL